MGKAIGISHAKHFLAINRRNEIAIGKRLAGFAIGNCENLGESFGELERDRSLKGAAEWLSPMRTVPEPAMTVLPCAPLLLTVAACRPFIMTVDDSPATSGLPQAVESVSRAAGSPSNKTFGEPTVIGLVPCPGIGQLVGSERRAAGLAIRVPFVCGQKLNPTKTDLSYRPADQWNVTWIGKVRRSSAPTSSLAEKFSSTALHSAGLRLIGGVGPRLICDTTHSTRSVIANANLTVSRYKKQYTGGTVPSFCHFCKIALKPSNDAAFSLFYLHQATHSFTGLETFLGNS